MPNNIYLDVVVNKITKADYDGYVADGTITTAEINQQVWIFTDDQFVSAADMAKLAGIEDGADVNIIEGIKVNGAEISPDAKIVNIVVPTKTSDLTNDSGFITSANLPTCDSLGAIPVTAKGAVNGVAELDASGKIPAAQLPAIAGTENVIDIIKVNGTALVPDANKAVDIAVPNCKLRIWS